MTMEKEYWLSKSDKIIRYIAFYISLALYFTLLPIVLSYSLGYHVDFHKFKIYKTGTLALKSVPSGASISINGRVHPDLTPARLEELKPGRYAVEVKREGFYPWQKDLVVRPNMVTREEDIILFPLSQEIVGISALETDDFAIPDERGAVYYMTKSGLYRSGMDGSGLKKISEYSAWPDTILKKKFSPDGRKLLYFNENGIWVIYLMSRSGTKDSYFAEVKEVFVNQAVIRDVFWHSGSNYLIFVADKDINVIQLGGDVKKDMVTLHKCAVPPKSLYYDEYNDALYFSDSQDGRRNVLRMDLREKVFEKFIQRVRKEFNILYEQK